MFFKETKFLKCCSISYLQFYFSHPLSDGDISICFNAATKDKSEKSCCSKSSELTYVSAAEKFLRMTIHSKNAYLKKLVMDHIVEYEGKRWPCSLYSLPNLQVLCCDNLCKNEVTNKLFTVTSVTLEIATIVKYTCI